MKNPNRETVSRLTDLPNIGKAIAKDLNLIGIDHPQKLIGKKPIDLYKSLCIATGRRIDLCVMDTFMAAVDFMEGGEPLAWWAFTPERKKMQAQGLFK